MKNCARCGEPIKSNRGGGVYCQPCGASISARKKHQISFPQHHKRAGVRPKPVTLAPISAKP